MTKSTWYPHIYNNIQYRKWGWN